MFSEKRVESPPMETQCAKRRIAVAVERSTGFGRNLLRGFAEIAGTRPEWDLSLLDPRLTAAAAPGARRFDAWVCRIPDDRAASALARTRRPVVDLATPHDQPSFATIATDAAAIGRLAAEHLLARRYPSFAFCGYPGIAFSDRRRDAFAASLANSGFSPVEYRPPRKAVRSFGADYRLGDRLVETPDAAALRAWLRALPKPVAVFCCDDLRAAQLSRACRAAGVSVPHDVAVLGVDDDPLQCLFASPRLSSVDSDSVEVGRAAARALAQMLDAPDAAPPRILVAPRGVAARASTDCWPGAPEWLPGILDWIAENAGKNLSACDVFRRAGRSRTLVERVFREKVGATVQGKIAEARIETAKRLLAGTARPLADVARASGYSSAGYFSRTFAAATGLAPTAWREANPWA